MSDSIAVLHGGSVMGTVMINSSVDMTEWLMIAGKPGRGRRIMKNFGLPGFHINLFAIVILFFLVLVFCPAVMSRARWCFFRGALESAYAWGEVGVKATLDSLVD
jgi:hypothetical protein